MKSVLTDEEVEQEIARLRVHPDVQLARAAMRLKYKRRQRLYVLRNLAKQGEALRKSGYTYDNLCDLADRLDKECEYAEPTEDRQDRRGIELPEWGISLPPKKEGL